MASTLQTVNGNAFAWMENVSFDGILLNVTLWIFHLRYSIVDFDNSVVPNKQQVIV